MLDEKDSESSEHASDQDSHGRVRQLRILLVISYV